MKRHEDLGRLPRSLEIDSLEIERNLCHSINRILAVVVLGS